MATRNRLLKYQIFTNAAMTGTSVVTSQPVNILNLDEIGIQLNFTGTPNGTFSVQISIDYTEDAQGNVTNVGNWVAMTLSPSPVATGSANSIYLDLYGLSAPWIRVQYTNTSSTGTLNGFAAGKMI